MKKRYFFLLFLFFLFPFTVKAEKYGLERFYMNVNVNEKGDLVVEEFIQMNGSYHGFDRVIHFKKNNLNAFTGADSDFGGSSIYNGTGAILSEVQGINLNALTFTDDMDVMFDSIRREGTPFRKVYSASNGDEGVYQVESDHIKMYNTKKDIGFYLKYTLSDMAILHSDVAEFGWDIFSHEMLESIYDFKVLFHLPNNKDELRAFAHGPLTGNIHLDGKDKVFLEVKGLPSKRPIDARIVFDKSIVSFASKKTDVHALDKILKYEKKMALDANQQREIERKEMEKRKWISYITLFLSVLWFLGMIVFGYLFYVKFDKEYKPIFRGKYFRDFPSDLNPEIVGYLMHKKITTNDLSASILHMIYKKKIGYEKEGKDFKLILLDTSVSLTSAEQKALDFLFDEEKEVSMKKFKKRASSGHVHFLNLYSIWHSAVEKEALSYEFFAHAGSFKDFIVVYGILGGIFLTFTFSYAFSPIFPIIFLISDFFFLIYILSATKRTHYGNEQYHKWLGLKRFMNDFGNFEKRDLPQIELWEKYMVYAVTFGVAKKLSKQMELKIGQYSFPTDSIYYGNNNFFTDMLFLNTIVSRDISSAHSHAISAQNIASSSNSSSGGFGGGFSSGGGSFGGGGGGGRF